MDITNCNEEMLSLLKDTLKEEGISQAELAKRVKVSRAYVSRMLTGGFDPGVKSLDKFFRAMGRKLEVSVVKVKR